MTSLIHIIHVSIFSPRKIHTRIHCPDCKSADIKLSIYKGKVLLVGNIASKRGRYSGGGEPTRWRTKTRRFHLRTMRSVAVAETEKVVCVTGASGFIASWLVKLLLRRGYTVRATVRNLGDPSKVEHLKALEGAEERLHLFEANLMEEGSFDSAIFGCDGVFHTASPVILNHVNDPQVELIEPAVRGTLNVLRSCTKAQSVKRVVLTSSMATVMSKRFTQTTDILIDETWFSDPLFGQETQQWYAVSKTMAEEAATNFAKENSIDLVVMNPGLVIGPFLQPTLNETSECFCSLISQGKSTNAMPGGIFVYVDVRDVGNAHILAFEDSSANGRYCLVAEVLSSSQVLDFLRKLYPHINFPLSHEENEGAAPPFQVSHEKAKSLGVNDFIPVEQSVKDTIESLVEKNFLSLAM